MVVCECLCFVLSVFLYDRKMLRIRERKKHHDRTGQTWVDSKNHGTERKVGTTRSGEKGGDMGRLSGKRGFFEKGRSKTTSPADRGKGEGQTWAYPTTETKDFQGLNPTKKSYGRGGELDSTWGFVQQGDW